MAMENKRIIQLSTERTTLGDDDYTIVDSDTNGTAKYRLSRLKETDTTLSVSGMAADAAATGSAISAEATARGNAVTAEAEARASAVTAEATARQTADTTLQGNITAEATARENAITAEATARQAADTTLQGNITAEAQARQAADTALGNDVDDLKRAMSLLHDEIPNTVQTYTFTDGSVSQVLHKSGNTTVRTDTFTYATNTITEVRTLNTGESLTIVTNLQTLETAVTYAAA